MSGLVENAPAASSFLERGRVRRRVRYLRRLREVQLSELGGFMVELERVGRDRPDLVRQKVAAALRTDAELRALEHSLGAEQPLCERREVGVGGACERCDAVHGSADRFCANCGASLTAPIADDSAGHDGGVTR